MQKQFIVVHILEIVFGVRLGWVLVANVPIRYDLMPSIHAWMQIQVCGARFVVVIFNVNAWWLDWIWCYFFVAWVCVGG